MGKVPKHKKLPLQLCKLAVISSHWSTHVATYCTTAKIHYLHPLPGCLGQRFRNTAKPLLFLLAFLFQCLTHTEKACKCSVIRRATETGAHRFLLPVFHLPTLHLVTKRRRGLLGRGVVCYLRGMSLPLLTACLSSICVQVHITVYRFPFRALHF